ncbi:addiction module component [Pseudomonas vanderleydeniana]|uniref:Addiction module component n=1 Tax=Pseudomonas vanderleydeniana TaxID=2745495 RepID=A0A9E6PHZ0_9PSED|nr:addiction module component [Pseudomonas vanderleydeniana]QXI26916.1 addiction module component [Pseudomonas vanderleydeniana]
MSTHSIPIFPRPDVPAALEDGLLPISALNAPLQVIFPVWNNPSTRHHYQLLWNNEPIGESLSIQPGDKPGDTLQLHVPVNALVEGHYQLAFRVTDSESEQSSESFPRALEIDTTAPGLPSLAPLAFPPEVRDGLTSEELTEMGDVLPGVVHGYTGFAIGDRVRTFWGATEGPEALVGDDDMEPRQVIIEFSRAFLESLDDFNGPVHYNVTDRAGNSSQDSVAVNVRLLLNEPVTDLPAPIIEDYVEPIDREQAQAGVEVAIPTSAPVQADDRILLHWGNVSLGPFPLETFGQPIILRIDVPFENIEQAGDGDVRLEYELSREGHVIGYSLPQDIVVKVRLPVPGELHKPLIRGASPDGEDNLISPDDFERDARAIITWNEDFIAGQALQLYWRGQAMFEPAYRITAGDVSAGRDLNLTVPGERFRPLGTGTDIRIHYSVTQAGNPNTSKSAEQGIIVRNWDELPGGRPGPDAPQFTDLNEHGAINTVNGRDGAPVHIAPYLNIKLGDVIHFLYEGFDRLAGGNRKIQWPHTSNPLNEEQVRNGYDLRIPRSVLDSHCYGHAEATFSVDSISGTGHSKRQGAYVDMRVSGVCPTGA